MDDIIVQWYFKYAHASTTPTGWKRIIWRGMPVQIAETIASRFPNHSKQRPTLRTDGGWEYVMHEEATDLFVHIYGHSIIMELEKRL